MNTAVGAPVPAFGNATPLGLACVRPVGVCTPDAHPGRPGASCLAPRAKGNEYPSDEIGARMAESVQRTRLGFILACENHRDTQTTNRTAINR